MPSVRFVKGHVDRRLTLVPLSSTRWNKCNRVCHTQAPLLTQAPQSLLHVLLVRARRTINSHQLAKMSQVCTDLRRTDSQGGIILNKEYRTTHESNKLRNFGVLSSEYDLRSALFTDTKGQGEGRLNRAHRVRVVAREALASPDPSGLFRPLHMGLYPARQCAANHLAGNAPARSRTQARGATLAWLAAGRDAPFTLSEMMRITHSLWLGARCVPIGAHGWLEALAWCRCDGIAST